MKKDAKINVMEHRDLLGSSTVNVLSKHGYAPINASPAANYRAWLHKQACQLTL
jgi:hypothetical protein